MDTRRLREERTAELQALFLQDHLWSFSVCAALSEVLWRGRGILKKLSSDGGRRDHPYSGAQMNRSQQRNGSHGSNCVEEEG